MILAIDHIENIARPVAQTVVRGVRNLYVNWDTDELPARLISVIMAGSHRLYRQAADHGSPLNFAANHEVSDLSIQEAYELLQLASSQCDWEFAPEAARLLANDTNGDKYLLHRLGHDCVEMLRVDPAGTRITLRTVQAVVDDFCTAGYATDSRFSHIASALVGDEDVLRLFAKFIEDPDCSIDYLELVDTDCPPNVKRFFRVENKQTGIRSPIYRRILQAQGEIVRSARAAHDKYQRAMQRDRRLRELTARLELLPSDESVMQDLLGEIRGYADAEAVHLLRYDACECTYRLVSSNATASVKAERDSLLDRDGAIRKRLLTMEEAFPCQLDEQCLECVGAEEGNFCYWLPLNLRSQGKQAGALVLRGKPWALSHSSKRGLDELGRVLASAIQRWRWQQGLRQLARLTVGVRENRDAPDSVQSGATLFNAAGVCCWEGSGGARRLEIGNSRLRPRY